MMKINFLKKWEKKNLAEERREDKETVEVIGEEASVDYEELIKELQFKHQVIKTASNLFMAASVIVVSICAYSNINRQLTMAHTEVSAELMDHSISNIENATYNVSYEEAYTLEGVTYYNVKIGDYTVIEPESAIELIGEDTVIETEIYVLEYTNTDTDYFLSDFVDHSVDYVRFSKFGESEFTEDDVNSYIDSAAKQLTYQKYSTLRYKDANNYKNNVPKGLVSESGIMSYFNTLGEE